MDQLWRRQRNGAVWTRGDERRGACHGKYLQRKPAGDAVGHRAGARDGQHAERLRGAVFVRWEDAELRNLSERLQRQCDARGNRGRLRRQCLCCGRYNVGGLSHGGSAGAGDAGHDLGLPDQAECSGQRNCVFDLRAGRGHQFDCHGFRCRRPAALGRGVAGAVSCRHSSRAGRPGDLPGAAARAAGWKRSAAIDIAGAGNTIVSRRRTRRHGMGGRKPQLAAVSARAARLVWKHLCRAGEFVGSGGPDGALRRSCDGQSFGGKRAGDPDERGGERKRRCLPRRKLPALREPGPAGDGDVRSPAGQRAHDSFPVEREVGGRLAGGVHWKLVFRLRSISCEAGDSRKCRRGNRGARALRRRRPQPDTAQPRFGRGHRQVQINVSGFSSATNCGAALPAGAGAPSNWLGAGRAASLLLRRTQPRRLRRCPRWQAEQRRWQSCSRRRSWTSGS